MKEIFFKRDLVEGLVKLETKFDTNIKGIQTVLEAIVIRLDNHLKHHEEVEKIRSDRYFKIFSIVFQVTISILLAWLIKKNG